MKPKSRLTNADKVELQMTPMIDVVFQLMSFFIMTFKVVAQEGDFNIKMPSVAPNPGNPDEMPTQPVRITLNADPRTGNLTSIQYNEQQLGSISEIRGRIIALVGNDAELRKNQEVEIHASYELKYHHTLEAVSQVSGFVSDGKPVTLIEKIKFSRPRPKGS
jgi:biopolymer transport protein ExbD